MLRKFILFATTLACISGGVFAQQPCATDDQYRKLLLQYPQLAEMEEQFNQQANEAKNSLHRTTAVPTIVDMAVVVHVVHDYGVENVSDNAIYEAVKNWTMVFMKENPDTADVIAPFKNKIGKANFRLHLATKDPNGNPTKGVLRHYSYMATRGTDEAKFESWDQTRYLNIWLVNKFDDDHAGAAAYAYYPSSASFTPWYDGVISLYNYLDYEKTMVHEIGHCMNLAHVWGSTNQPGVSCSGSDNVNDTPPTKGHNPTGCTAGSLYDTQCAAPDTVNAQNIMDYTYCSRMFTPGQVSRMRAALNANTAGRNNLYTSATLQSTGALDPMPDLPPIADFCVNKATGTTITDPRSYFLTIGNTALFNFKNTSWNDTISSVSWTLSNGASTPTSTNTGIVTSSFSQPGWVTISLTATSNAGTNTITNTHAVYAADTIPLPMGTVQKFANAASVDKWPMINVWNNMFKWEYYTGAGYDDNGCVRFKSYDSTNKRYAPANGDRDEFYTPSYDLTAVSGDIYVNFYVASASIGSGRSDSMILEASTTGGQRWTKVAMYNGSALYNNANKPAKFAPTTASQWKLQSVKLPTGVAHAKNTFFRFRYFAGATGNNTYIDNFSVGMWPADVAEAMNNKSMFSVFPNPATNGFNLVFNTGNSGDVSYVIRDITGKLVYQHAANFGANVTHQETIGRDITPAAGMYLITVTMDGNTSTQKLVVY